jgi:hypothetical protein
MSRKKPNQVFSVGVDGGRRVIVLARSRKGAAGVAKSFGHRVDRDPMFHDGRDVITADPGLAPHAINAKGDRT